MKRLFITKGLLFLFLISFGQTRLKKHAAEVFVFLSPECPLCISYVPTLNKLYKDYSKKSILFTGIVSDKSYALLDIVAYIKKNNILFPVILDSNNYNIHYYNAKTTPEAVLIDSLGGKLYQGGIDNWAYALGKKRKAPTKTHLADAIEQYLKGDSVKIKFTKAIGCFIE